MVAVNVLCKLQSLIQRAGALSTLPCFALWPDQQSQAEVPTASSLRFAGADMSQSRWLLNPEFTHFQER